MKKFLLLIIAVCVQTVGFAKTDLSLPFSMQSLAKEMQEPDSVVFAKYVYLLYDVDGDGKKELFVKEREKDYNVYYGFVIKSNMDVEEVFSRTSGGYEDFGYTDDGFMWHYEEHTGGLSQVTSCYKIEKSKVAYSTHRDIEMPSDLEGEKEGDMQITYNVSKNGVLHPEIEKEYDKYTSHGNTISLYQIEGWQNFPILERISGDLNKDGIPDEVVIETPRNEDKMEIRVTDGYEYNYNQPILSVFFGTKEGKKLFRKYANVIPHPESDTECLDLAVSISDKGILKIYYSVFFSMGSYGTNSHTYLYRFQNGDFYLIGEESEESMRNSGDYEKVSINYLTHKKQTVKGNNFDEKKKPVERWSVLPKKTLEKLGTRNLKNY